MHAQLETWQSLWRKLIDRPPIRVFIFRASVVQRHGAHEGFGDGGGIIAILKGSPDLSSGHLEVI